jgi:hypothetical protein
MPAKNSQNDLSCSGRPAGILRLVFGGKSA